MNGGARGGDIKLNWRGGQRRDNIGPISYVKEFRFHYKSKRKPDISFVSIVLPLKFLVSIILSLTRELHEW